MLAYLADRYGGPEVLRLADVERPTPGAEQVLVRVHATSMNPLDDHELSGEPWLMRLGKGVRRPKSALRGNDICGDVVEVGTAVTGIAVGDTVYGVAAGGFAEFALARPQNVAIAPTTISAHEAASLPIAGLTALQAVRKAALPPAGRLLVIGASGGVGTLAVQIATAIGAHVTGVCSTRNVELVRSLGAAAVVDYATGGLDTLTGPFDAIIDMVGSLPTRRVRRLLSPAGTFVIIGGPDGGRLLGPLTHVVRATASFAFGKRRASMMLAKLGHDDLIELAALVDAGTLHPVIDRVMPFDELPEALRVLETKRVRGKVVVTVSAN